MQHDKREHQRAPNSAVAGSTAGITWLYLDIDFMQELAKQIIATYERHGWNLRRVLLRLESRGQLGSSAQDLFGAAAIQESDFDALWFARASTANREAWELRSMTAQPFALFEAFEPDEAEEDREEVRREMENRMREQTTRP